MKLTVECYKPPLSSYVCVKCEPIINGTANPGSSVPREVHYHISLVEKWGPFF